MGILQEIDELDLIRTKLGTEIDKIYADESQVQPRQFLSDLRKIPLKSIQDARIIYSDNKEYLLSLIDNSLADYLGFSVRGDNVFRGRFIIPIPDEEGKLAGMSGYDSDSDIKYLFANTTYFDKSSMFYNLNNIDKMYKEGYTILVEGFFDSIRLSSIGLLNNLALMGTFMGYYHVNILNRLDLVILMGDGDEPGQRAIKFWQKLLKTKLACIHIKPKPFKEFRKFYDKDGNEQEREVTTYTKDIDAVLKFEPEREQEFKKLIKKIRKESANPFYSTKDYWF